MLPGLVDSRLAVPALPPWHVARPRLVAALDTMAKAPLVLLSAAPGAGKTALLAEWAGRRRDRIAWLCPTPDDNEPGRFRELVASALGVSPDPFPGEAGDLDFVHWLREELAGAGAPHILAVDDAHLLTDVRVASLLDKLVCYGHPELHVVLAARHDPRLPLHRYRLAGQLHELRTPELAMSVREVRDVLRAHRVVLPEPELNGLAERTEGWAAGARLAAMRMEQGPASAELVDEPSFGYGSAGEYFIAEVLDQLTEPLRRLLIETSFLDEVTGSLAEAVTHIDGAGDMLVELARDNWFVMALDLAGTRFRYHRLFVEVLRHLLASDGKHSVPELAGRAATCLEREGDLAGALRWVAKGGDPGRVASAVVQGGLAQGFAHRCAIPVAELAGVLPPAAGDAADGAHSDIPLAVLALDAATADSAAAARALAPALDAVPADRQLSAAAQQTAALVKLMLGVRACDAGDVDHAASRLTGPAVSAELRAAVLLTQASTHFWDGAYDDVEDLLNQALDQARRCGLANVQADVLAMVACVESYRSRPRHADDAAHEAHCLLRAHPELRTPTALPLAAAIRSIQQADFVAAARTLRDTQPSTGVSADPGLNGALALWRATLLALSGEAREARAVPGTGTADPVPALLELHRDVLLGEIETSRGRPEDALERLERHRTGRLAGLADVPCARAYLAAGDLDGARQSIRRTLAAARPSFSRYLFVDSMLLDARIAESMGDTARALDLITNALDVAHDEIALPFVQARDAFRGLLARHPAVAARWPDPPGTGQRNAVSGRAASAAAARERSARDLPVQLTPREQSVLDYLATSLTAADIAAELYLSVNTVKTHIAAIYAKLGAGRRREAVRRARELELL